MIIMITGEGGGGQTCAVRQSGESIDPPIDLVGGEIENRGPIAKRANILNIF